MHFGTIFVYTIKSKIERFRMLEKTAVFEKNIQAIGGTNYKNLREKLGEIKAIKRYAFDLDSKDVLNTNIFDSFSKKYLYKEPLEELETSLNPYKNEFKRYPSLFIYGLGNGFLYKALLQNAEHKRIIVYESQIELIFMVLNLIDFSAELSSGRFIIIYAPDYNVALAEQIFTIPEISSFLKIYKLELCNNYYEIFFDEEIKRINHINASAIKSAAIKRGNDPGDALMGIENYVTNLPKMLTRPTLSSLIKQRKNKAKFAILVATGPSLHKQLPLLKHYANKATIFCSDSSYHILKEHNIKPDYVLSMERIKLTSEFFNNDYGEFDKDIVFIAYTLTHPNTIKYLESNKRTYILTQRNLHFARYLNFKDFCFLGGGMSVMNMTYEFATMLGFKEFAFIGQDLAFGKDGQTHTKNYVNEHIHKDDFKTRRLYEVEAYGGDGKVQTTEIWNLFREIFEGYIFMNKDLVTTYNCTEGGARIQGTIEKPFKEFCEEFLAKEPNKKKMPKLKNTSRKEQNEYLLSAYKKIKSGMKTGRSFIKQCTKTIKDIQSITRGKQKLTLVEIIKGIDTIKERLEKKKSEYFYEILSPSLFHQEVQFSPLYVQNFNDEGERQNKMIAWIFAHEVWLHEIISLVAIFEERIRADIVFLEEELERRKLI